MKKIFLVLALILFVATGCFSNKDENILEKFSEYVGSSKSYYIKGNMEISNGEESYNYALESFYLEDNFYKVILVNETNNHEQIILRNNDSVYVVTPSLNKSFKFDSIWPDNSSQAYLLDSILNDIINDQEHIATSLDQGFEIKSKVNYPNNGDLSYQIITFDEDMIPKSIKVYDINDNVYITVNFLEINMNAKLDEKDFSLDDYVDIDNEDEVTNEEEVCSECEEKDETCEESCSLQSSSLDSILYPLYVPSNTSLINSETVMTDYSQRAVLTFAGENNFVIIEEASVVNSEFQIIPITGNPVLLTDTVGAISTNSIYFAKNGIDYYIVSNDLTSQEMVSIANSVGSIQSVMSTK